MAKIKKKFKKWLNAPWCHTEPSNIPTVLVNSFLK